VAEHYPEVSIFHSEARALVSTQLGQAFALSVWLPPGYAGSNQRYPVLYVLDANLTFGTAADAVAALILGFELPSIIVVGIGYPIQAYDDWSLTRPRDLTPTPIDARPGSGGAGRFLTFLSTDLIPFVEANYRADSTDRAIFGYSLGGLFVLYALLSHPGIFRRYIAGAPTVTWDSGFIMKLEADYASQHNELPGVLFVSTGSLDDAAADIASADAVLRARQYDGLEHAFLVTAGDTHLTGLAPALVRGVKWVFAPSRVENGMRSENR